MDDADLDLLATDTDQLIDDEDYQRSEKEVVEEWSLDHPPSSVEDQEDEEERVGIVDDPEATVEMTASILGAEHKDEEEVDGQTEARQTWKREISWIVFFKFDLISYKSTYNEIEALMWNCRVCLAVSELDISRFEGQVPVLFIYLFFRCNQNHNREVAL